MSVRDQGTLATKARRISPCTRDVSRAVTADKPWHRYASSLSPTPSPAPLASPTPRPSAAHACLLLEPYRTGAAADTQPQLARIGAGPSARHTQGASPAAAEASDGLSTLTQTPPLHGRSLSRRGSIAPQSSFSYQRGLEPASADSTAPASPLHRRRQQRTPAPLITGDGWGLQASTQSMPSCPPTARVQPGTPRPLSLSLTMAMPAAGVYDPSPPWAPGTHQDHRRRSAAHERYPPLTSIFESGAASGDPLSAQLDRWLADNPGTGFRALATFGPAVRDTPASASPHPVARPPQPASAQPIAQRRDSCDSLASAASIASSSSSEQSSYAYPFDSARPSVNGTPHPARDSRAPGGTGGALAGFLYGASPLLLGSMTAAAAGQPLPPAGAVGEYHPPSERSSLLGLAADGTGNGADRCSEQAPTPWLAARETRRILGMAGHLLASGLLQSLISMSQVASSGRLGRDELAAIGLAHMVVVLTGYPVVFGVLGCLETLASQASTSARPQLVGAYFVRAVQALWILGLGLGALWCFAAEPLLMATVRSTGGSAAVALAATYLRWYFAPFMVFSSGMLARQVLYAQGIARPLPLLTLLGASVT
ncbi:hypothetical protein H4R19_004703, partial [Coemansia spiralis]